MSKEKIQDNLPRLSECIVEHGLLREYPSRVILRKATSAEIEEASTREDRRITVEITERDLGLVYQLYSIYRVRPQSLDRGPSSDKTSNIDDRVPDLTSVCDSGTSTPVALVTLAEARELTLKHEVPMDMIKDINATIRRAARTASSRVDVGYEYIQRSRADQETVTMMLRQEGFIVTETEDEDGDLVVLVQW